MFSKKTVIVPSAAAGLLGLAALLLDVDIRLNDAWAAGAAPSKGEWSPTGPYPTQDVYMFNRHVGLTAAYRVLGVDYSSGGFIYDMKSQGLLLGLNLAF